MKVGAIVFDLDANTTRGSDRSVMNLGVCWGAMAGCRARRVSSIHELPTDVVWFTNLCFKSMYRTGLVNHPNFRSESWLRTSHAQLVSELGVEQDMVSPGVAAEALAVMAQRVITYAEEHYQIRPTAKRLNEDFAKNLGCRRSTIPDDIYSIFSTIAGHPFVNVVSSTNLLGRAGSLTVRRNRVEHARDILAVQVPPDTGWEKYKSPKSEGDSWLNDIERPFLVKCSVYNLDPKLAAILSWGSGSKNVRDWLTDIEWRVVREFGSVKVHSVMVSNGETQRLAENQLPNDTYAPLSITHGLVAENVWTSFCSQQPYRADVHRFSAAASWLRAKDRMIMFGYAQKLASRGLTIASYGVGSVVVSYPTNGLRRAIDMSIDCELMPPAAKFCEANKVLSGAAL